jgi:hypothetical protein
MSGDDRAANGTLIARRGHDKNASPGGMLEHLQKPKPCLPR